MTAEWAASTTSASGGRDRFDFDKLGRVPDAGDNHREGRPMVAQDLPDVLARLVHPDSTNRLAEVVKSTQLEAVFEDTSAFGSRQPLGKTAG